MTADDIKIGNAVVPHVGNGLWLIPGGKKVGFPDALWIAKRMAELMVDWQPWEAK